MEHIPHVWIKFSTIYLNYYPTPWQLLICSGFLSNVKISLFQCCKLINRSSLCNGVGFKRKMKKRSTLVERSLLIDTNRLVWLKNGNTIRSWYSLNWYKPTSSKRQKFASSINNEGRYGERFAILAKNWEAVSPKAMKAKWRHCWIFKTISK